MLGWYSQRVDSQRAFSLLADMSFSSYFTKTFKSRMLYVAAKVAAKWKSTFDDYCRSEIMLFLPELGLLH